MKVNGWDVYTNKKAAMLVKGGTVVNIVRLTRRVVTITILNVKTKERWQYTILVPFWKSTKRIACEYAERS